MASIVEVDAHPAKLGPGAGAPRAATDEEAERSCQPDSGKHAVTAADGIFLIDGVDSNAQFKVYVEAKGFRGRALILDPRAPRPLVEFKLVANPPMQEDRHRFLGQVLLPDGTPAVGVAVVTHNVQPFVPSGARYDTQATTDEEGRFVLNSEQAWQAMTVAVEPGCAKGRLFPLKAGPRGNTLQLDYGSTITGRVFHKARPAKGVAVALVAIPVAVVNRVVVVGQPQTSIAPITSTTDAEGRFAFEQVLSDSMYYLYTPIRGMLDENLAAIVREIRSPGGGQTLEFGEVNLHPATALAVRSSSPIRTHRGTIPMRCWNDWAWATFKRHGPTVRDGFRSTRSPPRSSCSRFTPAIKNWCRATACRAAISASIPSRSARSAVTSTKTAGSTCCSSRAPLRPTRPATR